MLQKKTYKGVDAYIYYINNVPGIEKLDDIPYAFKTKMPTAVDSVEYIPDAYDSIIQEVNKDNIVLVKYDEFIKKKGTWLKRIIQKEYE